MDTLHRVTTAIDYTDSYFPAHIYERRNKSGDYKYYTTSRRWCAAPIAGGAGDPIEHVNTPCVAYSFTPCDIVYNADFNNVTTFWFNMTCNCSAFVSVSGNASATPGSGTSHNPNDFMSACPANYVPAFMSDTTMTVYGGREEGILIPGITSDWSASAGIVSAGGVNNVASGGVYPKTEKHPLNLSITALTNEKVEKTIVIYNQPDEGNFRCYIEGEDRTGDFIQAFSRDIGEAFPDTTFIYAVAYYQPAGEN